MDSPDSAANAFTRELIYIPNRMDGNLLFAHESKEGVLHESTAYGLSGLGEDAIELLNMIASSHAEEFEHWLVILETEDRLVACHSLSVFRVLGPRKRKERRGREREREKEGRSSREKKNMAYYRVT